MPTNTDRKLRVFLCHSSQDKPIVRELYQRLSAEGWIDPWLDEEKLLPGQDWDMEIEKAVESADVVVVCLSDKSVTKEGYVQRELKFVIDIALQKPDGTIFVIPLRLEDCLLPRRLQSWQYLDYFPKKRIDWAHNRLVMSLKIRADSLDLVNNRKEEIEPASPPLKTSKRNSSAKNQSAEIKTLQELQDVEGAIFTPSFFTVANWLVYPQIKKLLDGLSVTMQTIHIVLIFGAWLLLTIFFSFSLLIVISVFIVRPIGSWTVPGWVLALILMPSAGISLFLSDGIVTRLIINVELKRCIEKVNLKIR